MEAESETSERKREAQSPSREEPSKRRAPYASKACEACRKRKGKCDGQRQCQYCVTKGLVCHYAVTQADFQRMQPPVMQQQTNGLTTSNVFDFISGLQSQLNALSGMVQASVVNSTVPAVTSGGGLSLNDLPAIPKELFSIQITTSSGAKQLSRFLGPTSPAFSMKAARSTLQHDPGSTSSHNTIGSYSVDAVGDEEEDAETSSDEEEEYARAISSQRQQRLLRFREKFSQDESIRLLQVYQNIIGDFHPIIAQEDLIGNLRKCYTHDTRSVARPQLEEDDLIMLNLAIAIALTTEAPAQAKLGGSLLRNCRELFSIRITKSTTDVNLIAIALLMAFYHFFRDNVVVAWRLCGVAGRFCMELGLHDDDAAAGTGDHRKICGIIISSIIVLDRQWSASSGLPIHFPNGQFHKKLVSEVEVPYLKSMLSFCLMSEKVAEPITMAAKGEICRDDETFDISNYQIQQWRKKTLSQQDLILPAEWAAKRSILAPWTILIYLRANTIKKLLLRPFFLPNAPVEIGKRNLDAGLDVVSETIGYLDCLDKTTDIYRRLHPHFQHLLASASALLSLMVAFVCQHRAAMSAEALSRTVQVVNVKYPAALKLAAKYKTSFRASGRLWRYLSSMEDSFRGQGFLLDNKAAMRSKPTFQPGPAVQATGDPDTPQAQAAVSAWHHFFPPPFQGVDFGQPRLNESGLSDDCGGKQWYVIDGELPPFNEADFAGLDWPLNDAGNFF